MALSKVARSTKWYSSPVSLGRRARVVQLSAQPQTVVGLDQSSGQRSFAHAARADEDDD